jgi:hypothetical protein
MAERTVKQHFRHMYLKAGLLDRKKHRRVQLATMLMGRPDTASTSLHGVLLEGLHRHAE